MSKQKNRHGAVVLAVTMTLCACACACASQGRDAPAAGKARAQALAETPIGYTSVADAYADISQRPGVKISERGGWISIDDAATSTLWTFAPPDAPAYPSVVRRRFVVVAGNLTIDMDGRCEASASACEAMLTDLKRQNALTLSILPPKGRYLDGGDAPPINRLTQ